LVLRILDRQSGVLALSDLGMPNPMMEQFDRVIHSRNGMILVSGPTGSGKTSTLYAALSRLDAQRLNIMTVEDPVEYELTGATQIAVNVKAGVTYESGLRSILRQDPDVIFIGEMRDAEAAKIAARAALTGHLMFSSVHAQDAIGTVMRLEDMGIERHQIASSLLMVVAQRLVRLLCRRCREAVLTKGTELGEIGLKLPAGKTIYRASGCDHCDMTGYQGRSGIFELLVFSEPLRKAIHDGVDQQRLGELAGQQGYRSYREDGVEKVLGGVTSVEEVLQAS
jgi:general secretion pathway protein E